MKKIDQSKCRHRFSVTSVRGFHSKTLTCSKCKLSEEVPLTCDEAKQMKARFKNEEREMKEIHSLGWAYQKEFYKWDRRPLTAVERVSAKETSSILNSAPPKGRRKILVATEHVSRNGFKYSGYEMMCRMKAFAKRHPEVVLCGCDDSSHCGSMIALIPHRSKKEYWGTTVVCIPQFGKVEELFFYPEHAVVMEKALAVLNREWREKKKLNTEEGYWPKP